MNRNRGKVDGTETPMTSSQGPDGECRGESVVRR